MKLVMKTTARNQRGVVILLVLSLLTIFMLLGVTFLIVASQHVDTARSNVRREQVGDQSKQHHDRAINQLIWCPPETGRVTSSLYAHDLLGDLYGERAISNLSVVSYGDFPGTGGQLKGIEINAASSTKPLMLKENYYAGCVLTMQSGALKGLSTRVIDYINNGTNWVVIVENFQGGELAGASAITGDRFMINDHAFDGTGAGYNTGSGNLDFPSQVPTSSGTINRQVALLPHFAGGVTGNASVGGFDESYDAVDYQNMYLAMAPAGATDSSQIIPSFHRPALANYWIHSSDNVWDQADNTNFSGMRRQVLFRPMPWDHPNFDGGNPAFAAKAGGPDDTAWETALREGPWDVDNDGDGVTDSIWIDVGFPVATGPDGQPYKPLVAFLVKDMDGRLNLNAHGSQQHGDWDGAGHIQFADSTNPSLNHKLRQSNLGPYARSGTNQGDVRINGNTNIAGALNPIVAFGQGYGPAEIYTGHLFSAGNIGEFRNILSGRYGTDFAPGRRNQFDYLSNMNMVGTPPSYARNVNGNQMYGSFPDVWGRQAFALDLSGQLFSQIAPTPAASTLSIDSLTIDNPYELDLSTLGTASSGFNSANYGVDTPYTFAELERLLRAYDHDAAQLPDRLMRMAPTTFSNSWMTNNLVTVESRNIPQPRYAGFPELRNNTQTQTRDLITPTIHDLFAQRLSNSSTLSEAQITTELNKIMPMEFFRGQLFNVNRRWGNGINEGAGPPPAHGAVQAVDNSLEGLLGTETAFPGTSTATTRPSGGDPLIPAGRADLARQIYARQLYCLMMLMMDQGYSFPFATIGATPGPGGMPLNQRMTAERVAQWAVNVVDARDVDSDMTRFEFDANPFNGWHNDCNGIWYDGKSLPAECGVVWGVEYPEMIITSTLATHDRRARDTRYDNDASKMDDEKTREGDDDVYDDDLDQYRVPEGSLFVELLALRDAATNPTGVSTPTDQFTAAFNYIHSTNSIDNKRHPLWRIAVSNHQTTTGGPGSTDYSGSQKAAADRERASFGTTTHPDSVADVRTSNSINRLNMNRLPGTNEFVQVEREIWFSAVNPTTAGYNDTEAARIFYNRKNTFVGIQPGQHIVLGPRPTTIFGERDPASAAPPGHELDYVASPQQIELKSPNFADPTDTGVLHRSLSGARTTPAAGSSIRQPVGVEIAANPPSDWTTPGDTAPNGIGINISEPLPNAADYYDEPTHQLVGAPGGRQDAYGNKASADMGMNTLPDQPFDEEPGELLAVNNMLATGTYENVRTLFLQRLASANMPWHPHTNPYITIDWATVDLTVYNGSDKGHRLPFDDPDAMVDPAHFTELFDPASGIGRGTPMNSLVHFRSRERGQLINNAPFPWSPITDGPNNWTAETVQGGANDIYFRYNLAADNGSDPVSTLGYLNSTMWTAAVPRRNYNGANSAGPNLDGSPFLPFAYFHHGNAPFATPYDIMQVPASSPSRLLIEYSVNAGAGVNPYDPSTPVSAYAPYRHLLNFYNSREVPATTNLSSNFHRLFDFIEVPSHYNGTQKWYDPDRFQGFGTAGSRAAWLQPPFNSLSKFRDPGRVNFNTIFNREVWEGINKNYPFFDPAMRVDHWNAFLQSRQGYTGVISSLDPTSPSRFAQPFQSSASADLNPIASFRKQGAGGGLLRSQQGSSDRLFATTDNSAHLNTEFNPYFHYQGMSRLGNIYSTTSNVFAVWTTVGYFEVEPTTSVPALGNPAVGPGTPYPEGFTLGREVGSTDGTTTRSRAFFMIDRSIPVGYSGTDISNAENVIRLRRYID